MIRNRRSQRIRLTSMFRIWLTMMHKRLSSIVASLFLSQGLCKVIHFFGDHQAAISKRLVVLGIHLSKDSETGYGFATIVRTDFAKTYRTGSRTTTILCSSRIVDRQIVAVFRASPPVMVRLEITHRKRHVINHALGSHIGSKDKISTMLGFTQ